MKRKLTTREIIDTTLCNTGNAYMPGAVERITKELGEDSHIEGWIAHAEVWISSEELTIKTLNRLGVTHQVLTAWQSWCIYRDEMI